MAYLTGEQPIPDQEQVEPMDHGSAAAEHGPFFQEQFRKYYPAVLYFFMGRGFDGEEARDLAQDTFLKAFHYLKDLRREASFRTWLLKIATTIYCNRIRDLNSLKRGGGNVSPRDESGRNEAFEMGPTPWKDPLDNLERKKQLKMLKTYLSQLPRIMVRCIYLRAEGCSYKEIAERIPCSMAKVKASINRARRFLREKLSEHFVDFDL